MNATAIALNRFGLGARPDDALPQEPRAWLGGQFAAFEPRPAALANLPDRYDLGRDLAEFAAEVRREAAAGPPAGMAGPEMADASGAGGDALQPMRASLRQGIRDRYTAMNAARLESALTTRAPFVERLVHFWANHFAVSADKVQLVGMAGLLEFEAIRPNVLGRFGDLLLAAERHPAMLLYLDQAQSIGPNSGVGARTGRRGAQRGPNENLAREILELHTLGVSGGYTQADVTEFARALTGWTVGGLAAGRTLRLLGDSARAGEFAFLDQVHEPGERMIFGRRYAAGGEAQARAVLADLAVHPATARHLATKLARHFAGDDPPQAMVARIERAWLDSGGDLPAVYRAIVASPEAWTEQPVKFKTPWEWVVSALRAVSAERLPPSVAGATLGELGQPTWRPGSPAGWDDIAASWAGPDALVRRAQVAERLAGRGDGSLDARALAERVLPAALGEATRQAIARADSPQQGLALLLVSPEFLRR